MRCERCESRNVQIGDLLKDTPDVCLECGYIQKGLFGRIKDLLMTLLMLPFLFFYIIFLVIYIMLKGGENHE